MISAGGSSLMSTLICLGMLLSVSEHSGLLKARNADGKRMATIVMAGGGTGGHVMPLLAVARELASRRPSIRFHRNAHRL
jgi:Na+/H+ antiporter NhaC